MPDNDRSQPGAPAALRYASHIIILVLAFMLAKTPVLGMYPFAAALVSAVGYGSVFTASLGAAASCMLPPGGDMLYILASILAACAARRALSELRGLCSKPLYPAAVAFFSIFSGRLVSFFHYGGTAWTDAASALCEALFSASCAYFFSQCFSSFAPFPDGGSLARTVRAAAARIRGLPSRRRGACMFTACVFLVPLCRITAGGFSPFSALVLAFAVLAARSLSPSSACVVGTAAGVTLSAASGNITYTGICAAAAAISSLFAPLSGILCAGVFSAVCTGISLASGSIDIFFIAGSLIAAGAGAAVPYRWLGTAKHMPEDQPPEGLPDGSAEYPAVTGTDGVVPSRFYDPCRDISYFTASRLRSAAEALSEVSAQTLEVSSRLDRLDAESPRGRQAIPPICSDCGISAYCWGELSDVTENSIREIKEKLGSGGHVTDILSGRCPRWGELISFLENEHREHAEKELIRRRIAHIRTAVSCQLGCVSALMTELSERMTAPGSADAVPPEEERYIFTVFDRFCRDPSRVHSEHGEGGRFSAVFEPGAIRREYVGDMIRTLSDSLGWTFDTDENSSDGTLTVRRTAPFKVVFGTCQAAKNGAQLCGDSYSAVCIDGGRAAVILSDGMGTGGRAAIDAAMTCGMMKRLLTAGFDARGAMGMVNSALMLRAEDEPLATVDCAIIDLFSGNAALEKAGAAASFIRRGRKTVTVSPESLPLGIMDSVDSSRAEFELGPGDTILMVSDGVIGDGSCGWIEAMLSGSRGDGDMRELACAVVEKAGETCDDDLTAVAVRIVPNDG